MIKPRVKLSLGKCSTTRKNRRKEEKRIRERKRVEGRNRCKPGDKRIRKEGEIEGEQEYRIRKWRMGER